VSGRLSTAQSPPLGLIAPFFLLAPLGLIAGGLLVATHGDVAFVAINHPRTVAITHAIVLGWITTTIMGASYQLGPVVLGGQLLSVPMARVQLVIHVSSVAWFVWSLFYWNGLAMAGAATGLALSFLLFLLNAGVALKRGNRWTLPRAYVAVALGFLVITALFGGATVGSQQEGWFVVTFGKLSAHAHLGLVGWIGLMVMGVSYQLIPMFHVINRATPRYGWHALALTAASLTVFAVVIFFDPPAPVRVLVAALLATGPLLWALDILRLFRARSRRRIDIHGRATLLSLGFLVLAILLGVTAASGTPLISDREPARLLLAYAAAAILGFAGAPLIGNSYKVLPFLIWFHRYRLRIGNGEPVPVVDDIYNSQAAHTVLAVHSIAVLALVAAALLGELILLQAGGMLLAAGGIGHLLTMLHMFLPKQASRQSTVQQKEVLAQ